MKHLIIILAMTLLGSVSYGQQTTEYRWGFFNRSNVPRIVKVAKVEKTEKVQQKQKKQATKPKSEATRIKRKRK